MIELLEHNVETYRNLCKEMKKHNKVALIQATGTGKSYIISKYIEEHCNNALILVPANAIGDQWQKLLPNTEVKTYQAMAKGIEGEYDLIVADEMHHLGSAVWGQKFIEYFMQDPMQNIIGATATEIRYLDNARDMVEEIFDGVAVRGVDLATAIDKGILPTFKYVTAYYGSEEDFNEYREKANSIKDIQQRKDLSRRLEMCIQNRISIKAAMYENLSMANHNIIVFLNGLCEIEKAIEMFKDMFPDCECNYVSSKSSTKENETSILQFQQSKKKISVLLAVDMLNEGVHIKGVDAVVMFRNTESPQVYFQQMGRVLDTNNCGDKVVFDFACNIKNIKVNLNTDDECNVIYSINEIVKNKKRKIILRSYVEDIQNILSEINILTSLLLTEQQQNFIRENTEKTLAELSRELDVHYGKISYFCNKNGIVLKAGVERSVLTDDQKEYIKINAEKGIKKIANVLGVSINSVAQYCRNNGIRTGGHVRFTQEEKEFIRNNTNLTVTEISERLGKKSKSVAQYCRNNGITLLPVYQNKKMDTSKILEMYAETKNITEISRRTGFSRWEITALLKDNGINIKRGGHGGKTVMQIDRETNQRVAIYESISEASQAANISPTTIRVALQNKNRTAGGFKWRYANE